MSDGKSILQRLEQGGRPAPRLDLKGANRDPQASERYEILGEIARGGVGVVHRGRDNDLGRDVALKVLLDHHLETPELVQRFVEEAQIGGQLQHPGVVPVYELGLNADDRPYFAMKLVKGETLAARLAKRAVPADSLRELLAVFREICRTMAYAHARGVIHRDLKPSNVMIGNFGEIQVVDWGFAKVLRKGGVADERLAKKAQRDVTMISTVRSNEGSAPSVAGSVLGTPAYMPPEQALGRIEDLDERSDVFSLGAILCEILTGEPPYRGAERMQDAASALLEPAVARLDGCGANTRLVDLCKRCLRPLPKDRPAGAEAVADEIAAYLTSAEGRAHRARLRALKAEDRAAEQRRSRRFLTILGTSMVAALVLATAMFFWIDANATERRRTRRAAIEAALQDAARHRAAKRWAAASAAAQRALDLGDGGELAAAIREEARDATERAQRAREDKALLANLENVRARGEDHFGRDEINAAYENVVRAVWPAGEVDVARLKASPAAPAFAAVFDAWARTAKNPARQHAWARAIDPDSNSWRDVIAAPETTTLEARIASTDVAAMPAALVEVIAVRLRRAKRHEPALRLLRAAQRLYPNDFWIHMRLAWSAHDTGDHVLALDHAVAALAVRPDSLEARHWIGIFLQRKGDVKGALAEWRIALDRNPDWIHGWAHIVHAMELVEGKDAARAFLERGLKRFPKSAEGWACRGRFEIQQRNHAAAIRAFEKAVELEPDNPLAMNNLAWALRQAGRLDVAIVRLEKAVRQNRGSWLLHNDLAAAYAKRAGHPPRAEDFARAVGHYERALELNPDNDAARTELAVLLTRRRDRIPDAVRHLEIAVRRNPRNARMQRNLALQYLNVERYGDAVAHLEKATALAPGDPANWQWLARARAGRDGTPAAVAWLERRAEDAPAATLNIAHALADGLGRRDRAIPLFRRVLARNEHEGRELSAIHYALGSALMFYSRFEEALPHFKAAVDLLPYEAQAWCNYGTCLRGLGHWSEAVDALRKGHEIGSKRPDWRFDSAKWLAEAERFLSLEPRLARVLKGEPVEATPRERALLARMLATRKHYDRSIELFRRALAEDPALTRDVGGEHARAIRTAVKAGPPHRKQALKWFREWLGRLQTELDTNPARVRNQIGYWMRSSWFAKVRDGDVPEEWQAFWRDAKKLQAQAAKQAVAKK